MKKVMMEKFKNSVKSVLPITVIVLIICLFLKKDTLTNLIPSFLFGSILLVCGMFLFDLGSDISMITMGEKIGNHLTKKKSIPLILIVCFLVGTIITMAEPDLNVLASQVPSISSNVLILTVGIGVGIFLVIAALRILFQINFSLIIIILCMITFILSYFAPSELVPLAFDSGGVTTGPLSVPLILALGTGLSAMRNDSKKKDDTFGMMALCSIGPVIIVLILGLIYKSKSTYDVIEIVESANIMEMFRTYLNAFPIYFGEVLRSLGPIVIMFVVYNLIFLRLRWKDLNKIFVGLIYTYIGLSIFLAGVNIGFMPMGYLVGKYMSSYVYLLVPLGVILGYFIVSSEPAVSVLTSQIEDITNGNIKKRIMDVSLAIGVSIATGLSVLRIITGISVWYFLLPGYIIAIVLSFFVPKVFIAIAFDSGGVASGTMTATFLLPFAIGIAEALGKNVLTEAFGLIAIVATIPYITVEIVGLVYKIKIKAVYKDALYNEEIIDY